MTLSGRKILYGFLFAFTNKTFSHCDHFHVCEEKMSNWPGKVVQNYSFVKIAFWLAKRSSSECSFVRLTVKLKLRCLAKSP